MKKRQSLPLELAGVASLLAGFVLWIYGGAQVGFYKTFYTVEKTDEITGLSYRDEIPAFLPGIETLAAGFALFAGLLFLGAFLDRAVRA